MNMNSKERQASLKNRPRKILSLEERVQALRMFDQTPVYQRVATAFQCSWEQIKNVVISRDEIMAFYARCQTIRPKDHPNQVRKKKILFLGNVVFEYIKRALYHGNAILDETQIRERALEFRDLIDIEKFYPNNAWFNDFKRVYNIDFECTDNIVLSQPPPKSLDCQEIIEYCRNDINEILKGKKQTSTSNKDNNSSEAEANSVAEKTTTNDEDKTLNDRSSLENTTNRTNMLDDDFDEDDINEDEEGETIDFSKFDENAICDSTKPDIEAPKRKKSKRNVANRTRPTYNRRGAVRRQTTTAIATPTTESAATTRIATTTTESASKTRIATATTTTNAQSTIATTTTNAQSTTAAQSSKTTAFACTKPQSDAVCSLQSIKEEEEQRSSSPKSAEIPIPELSRATVIREAPVSTAANINVRPAYNELTIPAQIFDTKAAITHLFPLQDFALAEEDFVAINLLEKLAAHYRGEPKKNEPIETDCSENT